MGPKEILGVATQAIRDKKGQEIVVLDLTKVTLVADYFVMVTVPSKIQARAVCDHIVKEMEKNGIKVLHREGYENSRWILLDYGSVVIHIFQPEERKFYNLERVWGDAPKWEIEENGEQLYGML